MEFKDKTEQSIYNRAGGGEKGEKAVMAYREYINGYNRQITDYMKEKTRRRYLPVREKSKGTNCIMYDEYE